MVTEIFSALALVGSEWVLYLLIILSIITLGAVIDKFITLRYSLPHDFSEKVLSFARSGELDRLRKYIKSVRACEARILESFIEASNPSSVSKILFEERLKLERGLAFLGTMGNNAPFIGLFGTVLGIIKAFYELGVTGAAGPQVVMVGIAEALIATALGLLIAIPAVIFYNVFQRRIRIIIRRSEMLIEEIKNTGKF